jgi:hypothetical protein
MPYSADIDALSPDHAFSFDGNATDRIAALGSTAISITYTGPALCEGVSNSMLTNATGDRLALDTATDLNNSAQDRKTVAGWFMTDSFNLPPKTIYREGGTGSYFQFVMWAGNKVMLDVSNSGGVNPQAISNKVFTPNRAYHICAKIEGTGQGNFIKLYIDGVEQDITLPDDGSFGAASLNARSPAEFGDASGSTEVGQASVLLNAPLNGYYNHWATWQGANAQLTDTEIREELFEKGALPDVTITNQSELDALADSVRPNVPCCIRVTGSGTINLTADNVTFSPLASIHVQYTGTGTLNWTNTNGSNASIGSTPAGGTINFINPATLTINGLINGAEVRIYDDEIANGNDLDTELDGIETLSGTSFVFNHSGATNDVWIQMIADGYEEVLQKFTLDSTDQTLTVFPIAETNA